jgi:hypothetical protein
MNEPKEVSGLEAAVNTALVEIPLPVENFTTQLVDYKEVHAKKIQALADEADALPIPSTSDEREQLRKHRMSLVRKRTGMNDFRMEFFAPLAKAKKEFDGYVGTTMDSGLQGQIRAIEQRIEAKEKVWDDAQEEIRRAAQELIQRRNQQRAQTLMDMLFHYDGARYTLGSLVKSDQDLRTEPDEVFQRFVLAAGPEVEKHRAEEAERTERKRLEAEQNERNRKAFEEQGRKQKQMDEDRAAIDREKAQLRSDRISLRMEQMVALGARTFTKFGAAWIGQEGLDFTGWAVETLADIGDDQWAATKQRVSEEAAEVKRREDEANAKAQRKEVRAEALIELGASYDGDSAWTLGQATVTDKLLADMDDADWNGVLTGFQLEHAAATIARVQVIEEEEPLVAVDLLDELILVLDQNPMIEEKYPRMIELRVAIVNGAIVIVAK